MFKTPMLNLKTSLMALVFLWGFYGCADTEDLCQDVDCGLYGVCGIKDGEATCVCEDGFISVGTSCVTDPCRQNPCAFGTCVPLNDKPTCRCDNGYAGLLCDKCAQGYLPVNGVCLPGDACESDPCYFGVCISVDGKPVCSCDQGYTGELCDQCAEGYIQDGLNCVDGAVCNPNPCPTENDDPHRNTCVVEGHTALCVCDEGYEFIGDSCIDKNFNPCEPNPCTETNRTVCQANGINAVCLCDDGYFLLDDKCVDNALNPCIPNPCPDGLNRSQCVPKTDGYVCDCDAGYKLDDSDQCVEDTSTIEVRSCDTVVRFKLAVAGPVYLRGEFNGWSATSHKMNKNGDYWELTIPNLAVGDYAYKIFWQQGGHDRWELDPDNPYTKWVGGTQNSLLRVTDCNVPALTLKSGPNVTGGSVSIEVQALMGNKKTDLDPATAIVTRNGQVIESGWDENTGVFTINESGLSNTKYAYIFNLSDTEGRKARPLFVPVWVEDDTFDWRDASMYFILTDRFNDGDASNNNPISDHELKFPANWQGGDFKGITAKINDGYFDDMGINCLWVSSPIRNTQGAYWGSDGQKYSGYHSYWPTATGWTSDNTLQGMDNPIEPHFGNMNDFKAMVAAAHVKGIRIIVDFVANHVHTDAPLYQSHKNDQDPWFHWDNGNIGQGYVCGWEKPIECWFAEYLPDFDYRNSDVMDRVMDHAIWLIQETNIDGFRLDAVKHMILDFSSTLRARIDEEVDTHDDIRFYMVGETFTGEGDGEKQTIKDYVSPKLLDGQFDFPMFWAALASLVRHERGLDSLKGFMDSNDGYYGQQAVMSTFLGNHDVPRVLSHAAAQISDMWGNGSKEQGWNNPPSAPTSEDPYKRLKMAWTFLFSQNGIPLVYYGDEIGMPGAGDPDNRRFMRFDAQLSPNERSTLEHVQILGKTRQKHSSMRTGQRRSLVNDANFWAYTMKDSNDAVLVVLNRGSSTTRTLSVGASGLSDGNYVDAISGKQLQVSGGSATVQIGTLESAIYERK